MYLDLFWKVNQCNGFTFGFKFLAMLVALHHSLFGQSVDRSFKLTYLRGLRACYLYLDVYSILFLASQDALEVMSVTHSVTYWTLALT